MVAGGGELTVSVATKANGNLSMGCRFAFRLAFPVWHSLGEAGLS
jgi:hypothetical protein